MALKQINAALVEPVTLAEAKAYLRVDGTADDEMISTMITAARRTVEAFCSRCLINQSWSFTLNAGFVAAKSDFEYLHAEHSKSQGGIEIPKGPFVELVSDPVLIEGEKEIPIRAFRLDTLGASARIHLGGGQRNSSAKIRIDFVAGYGDDPQDIPAEFKQAILIMVADLYKGRGGNSDPHQPPLIDRKVRSLLEPYRMIRLG